ncbi:arad-like aldolase/epimerase, partial [Ceraceosorus guamensis]
HAIHTARPEVDAACHSHSLYGKAFSTLGRNIEITTQDSCVFYKRCAHYDSFGGVAVSEEEGQHIAEALGKDNVALIMANHGILTAGKTIESAVHRFIALERHCQVQLLADAASARDGKRPTQISDEEAEYTANQTASEHACWFQALGIFEMVDFEAKQSGYPYAA